MSSIIVPKSNFIMLPDSDKAALLTPEMLPLIYIDPLRSNVSPETRKRLLKSIYEEQLVADGLSCGKLHLVNGQLMFKSSLSLPSFSGFVFEAFFVREFNSDKLGKGKSAFLWCTERKMAAAFFLERWKAIGKGHLEAGTYFPNYDDAASSSDVVFLREIPLDGRWEQAMIVNTTIPAGIQVKAITGGEGTEIVDKLISGRYQHVLTCLRHPNGKHSYAECLDIIMGRLKDGIITPEQAANLMGRLSCPELLGFDQRDIEEYRAYIGYWYAGMAQPTDDIVKAASAEIAGYHRQGSLLVPD